MSYALQHTVSFQNFPYVSQESWFHVLFSSYFHSLKLPLFSLLAWCALNGFTFSQYPQDFSVHGGSRLLLNLENTTPLCFCAPSSLVWIGSGIFTKMFLATAQSQSHATIYLWCHIEFATQKNCKKKHIGIDSILQLTRDVTYHSTFPWNK